MEHSIYKYVNQFPEFESLISKWKENQAHPNKTSCENFKTKKLRTYTALDAQFPNKCEKVIDYLDEVIKVQESSKPAFCKYINYWLYDTLSKMPLFSHPSLLNGFYEEITKLNVCNEYKKSIDGQIYEELKKLYNLYEYFLKFKTETTEDNGQSCRNIEQCVSLYETYSGDCKENYNNGFCGNLIKFREVYEYHRAQATRCVKEMKYLKPIKSDLAAIVLLPFVAMTLISFILIFLYKFTSFGSWIRPKLGVKNKTSKLEKKMQEFQNISENEGRRYKLPYHTSYS